MRVLSVGQLEEGGTCLERARVLRSIGWDVVEFDILKYSNKGGRVRRSLQHRLLDGPDVRSFNKDLVRFVKHDRKFDLLWIDKGRWLFADVLKEIKTLTGALTVHYTPDPAFTVHTSRHFFNGINYYDICVTTKRYEIEKYKEAGANKIIFTLQGIDDRFSRIRECEDVESETRDGLVFVGHRERYYERTLSAVARSGLNLRVWGPGWEASQGRYVQGGAVMGDHYPRTLAQGKVGIGLLSKLYPDAFTTRTFEMPAAGLMMIAERTPEHEALFDEGREAEFFSDIDELVEKGRYYMNNDRERIEIARRGREKVLRKYTWKSVMHPVIEEIQRSNRA